MIPLNELKPGQLARVLALRSGDPARLDRLSAFGLVPGSLVRVEQARPTLIFRVGETEVAVDHDVAAEILVQDA
jgi:DtxR family Mn-dependent transcriptional regulator